jgi:hypothetical protein
MYDNIMIYVFVLCVGSAGKWQEELGGHHSSSVMFMFMFALLLRRRIVRRTLSAPRNGDGLRIVLKFESDILEYTTS